MKTLKNTPAIPALKMDEIIFEGRNKEYGAYNLRKKYNKHVIWAFTIACSLVSTTVATAYITANRHISLTDLNHTTVIDVEPPPAPPIAPPPPPPDMPAPATIVFSPPVFSDTVTIEPTFATIEDVIELGNGKPVGETPPVIVIDPIPTDVEPPLLIVDVAAQFEGGTLESFRNWVMLHLKYPEQATALGLEGKVTLQFVVNKTGKVENILIMRGVDPLLDNEALAVIKSSPKWTPGLVKGKAIRQMFTMPITFKLQK